MSVNPYKKQKLFINNLNQFSTPKTTYDAPRESLVNFPSSVMSGVTKEGGLMSLSVKSITCSELVENLDCMRQVLINDKKFEPIRLVEEHLDKKKYLDLKENIEPLKETLEETKASHQSDKISNMHKKLNESLEAGQPLSSMSESIFELIHKDPPYGSMRINDGKFSVKRNVQLPVDVHRQSESEEAVENEEGQ